MKNLKYIAIASLAVVASSCANFLEPDPKGQMAVETSFQTVSDLNLAMNALYHQVQASQTNSNSTIVQLQGDDITVFNTAKNPYYTADTYRQTIDYKGVEALWSGKYRVIQAANNIINNAERAKEKASDAQIKTAIGNALFWRACSYLELVRVFGPLPVNLTNEATFNTPMTSVADIYKMILDDLETADSYNLPTSYKGEDYKYGNTDGCNYWVTQQAIKAALSAAYMARAGYPFYDANSSDSPERTAWYKKAADAAYQVIKGVNEGTYDNPLETDWKQVYSYGNNWSKEQLITISFYATPGQMGDHNTDGDISQFSLCQLIEQYQGGWGDFIGERKWWSTFPDGPRKNVVYEPSIYTGMKDEQVGSDDILQTNWWATSDEQPYNDKGSNSVVTVYHPTFASMITNIKGGGDTSPAEAPYDCTKPAYIGQQVPSNHRYIRYSEVICWFAEAVGRGNITEYENDARTELQKVMNRAYDIAPSTAGLSGTELAEAAYNEHGYEVTGYPLALCTRRSDQFRLDRLKETWEYRRGPQDAVLVPAGTRTIGYAIRSIKVEGSKRPVNMTVAIDYSLTYDLKTKENVEMAETWNGYESMYMPYPPKEVIKNPNIKRVSAFN